MTKKKIYGLRTCNADMTSYNGFKWPKRGKVKALDWLPSEKCGNGLHCALWGEGNGSLFSWEEDAVWQVVRIDSEFIDLGGKVKFEFGYVVYSGDRKTATDKIIELGARGPVIGAFVTSGDHGTSISGDYGTSTSEDYGTSTSEDYGTSTSEDYGTSTSEDYGTSTSGDWGTSTSGDYGISTSGDYGISTSGWRGTSTSGYGGTSTSGDYGISTSGDRGTSTSGYGGTSTSGERGTLIIEWWDKKRRRLRWSTGYVGENGIKPNVPYKLNGLGEFVEVK